MSLEFFANFLFQDKKLGGLGCNPKFKRRNLFQDNRAAINEAKNNKQQRVKKYRGSEASEGVQPQEKLKMFNHKRCYYKWHRGKATKLLPTSHTWCIAAWIVFKIN